MKNTELVNRFFDAQNQRDRAACSGLMHPEIMWFLHGEATHTPIAGREDCLNYLLSNHEPAAEPAVPESLRESASGNRVAALLPGSVVLFDFEDGLMRWVYEYRMDEEGN